MQKLEKRHKHILKLIAKDKLENGWTQASDVIYPYIKKDMPKELIECDDDTKMVRLTEEGKNILSAMAWLE